MRLVWGSSRIIYRLYDESKESTGFKPRGNRYRHPRAKRKVVYSGFQGAINPVGPEGLSYKVNIYTVTNQIRFALATKLASNRHL